jgi:hypothetical protein
MVAAIVFVAGMGCFGLKKYKDAHTSDSKQPTDGPINGGVYTNHFFQFSVQFPASRVGLSTNMKHPQAKSRGSILAAYNELAFHYAMPKSADVAALK